MEKYDYFSLSKKTKKVILLNELKKMKISLKKK